jgi:hypothetical protein
VLHEPQRDLPTPLPDRGVSGLNATGHGCGGRAASGSLYDGEPEPATEGSCCSGSVDPRADRELAAQAGCALITS